MLMDREDLLTMDDDPNNNGLGGGCIKKEKSAAEMRKSNKPLMERKRRERINNCLQQLKSILMEVTKKESSYYSKLEKADILEMTVKYLKNMKRQQLAVAMTSDPTVLGKYIAGYNECTTEITKYLNSVDGLNTDTRTRLLNHLANSLQRNSISMAANTAVTNLQLSMNQACGTAQPLGIQIPAATQLSALPGTGGVCVLNQTNQAIQAIPASAMQLVPAKLPSGELVFLLANQHTTVSPQGSGVSVVSTVQNNVNNININPNIQSQVTTQTSPAVSISGLGSVVSPSMLGTLSHTQLAFPANVSAMSPILLTSKGLESPTNNVIHCGASTSGSSPESDISEASSVRTNTARSASRSYTETPHRRREMPRNIPICSAESESSSDSDNNDEDVINNNNFREESVIHGPMWRPW